MFDEESDLRAGIDAGAWTIIAGVIAVVVVVAIGYVAIQGNLFLDNAQIQAEQQSDRRERMFSQIITDRWSGINQTRGDIADLEAQVALYPQLYGENTAVWPQGKAQEYQQLQTQLLNRRSAYRNQCADYEAMWLDQWRREVAPDGVPMTCPVLE